MYTALNNSCFLPFEPRSLREERESSNLGTGLLSDASDADVCYPTQVVIKVLTDQVLHICNQKSAKFDKFP